MTNHCTPPLGAPFLMWCPPLLYLFYTLHVASSYTILLHICMHDGCYQKSSLTLSLHHPGFIACCFIMFLPHSFCFIDVLLLLLLHLVLWLIIKYLSPKGNYLSLTYNFYIFIPISWMLLTPCIIINTRLTASHNASTSSLTISPSLLPSFPLMKNDRQPFLCYKT